MPVLYRWESVQGHVGITPKAHAFLKTQAAALELIANFYWAEFLEGCNRLAPRIVQKVSRDGASRKPLQKYLKVLREESNAQCFYCEAPLGEQRAPAVDHVIPWSFLLEDDLWDLVLACTRCNSAKSDWLPDRAFIEKLLARNRDLSCGGISLAIGEPESRAALRGGNLGGVASVLVAVKRYGKLVRDRIPEIIERAGKTATWRELGDGEFRLALKAKALEEAQELFDADDDALLSELADLEEVVAAILTTYGYSREELEMVRAKKNEDRGAFMHRLFLKSASD